MHAAEAATLEELLDRLDQLLAGPRTQRFDGADYREVRRWAEAAAARLASRKEALRLVREIARILAQESRTAVQVDCAKERVESRLALVREHATGTHWPRRDSGRRAKRPAHVDVDPAAWRRAKTTAARQGMTIGHYVGTLVRSAVERRVPPVDAYEAVAQSLAGGAASRTG